MEEVKKCDKKSSGYTFLSFLFPTIGAILYYTWKEEKPLKASSCFRGTVVGAITLLSVITFFALIISIFIVYGLFFIEV